jgi:hypothetical protein
MACEELNHNRTHPLHVGALFFGLGICSLSSPLVEVNEVFGGLDYPHDLSHDLSERTVYIPSASLCCYDRQRAITPSDHRVLVAESFVKDLLLAVISKDC